jgi:dihydroorotase
MSGKPNILITNGRLLDPASGLDKIDNLYVADGAIAAVGGKAPAGFRADATIAADGLIVCPGLIDMCARLREPGQEHKAGIGSETRAAAHAGITTLCIPPDTEPVIDEPAVIDLIQKQVQISRGARVAILGALTMKLAGEQLSEMAGLKQVGCVGVSNALRSISDTRVLRRAMEYANTQALTVHIVPLDRSLARNGVAHAGAVATRLGLPGIPVAAETVAIAQILALIEETGARVHFGRLSSARAVDKIAGAKQRGLPVSADVAVHHLFLTETAINDFDGQAHVIPPLRAEADRQALVEGLRNGVIDAICSDHQPHDADAKLYPYPATEPGISGLDTLLGLTHELAVREKIPLSKLLAALTCNPAKILGISAGQIAAGRPADLCLFNPAQNWTVESHAFASAGKNTPMQGMGLRGAVVHTVIDGMVVQRSS